MLRFLSLLLLLLSAPAWGQADSGLPLRNQLDGHSSPYLDMHGQDPVAWQPWEPEAFALARRENRMLFVSVGYFACHWCHVMQRESYQNPQIAELINQHYVPIKIDRELLPGIDKRLMDFTERTRGRGGWPLNIFLTPDGYPLLAVLYEPPGRFRGVLTKLQQRWDGDSAELTTLAHGAQAALEADADAKTTDPQLQREQRLAAFLRRAMSRADDVSGGFGNQTKFPSTPQLEALLALNAAAPGDEISEFLRLTLDQMASQGLRDQLGGGFYRYTVDQNWQIPHFEKMLYDNAQLAWLYLEAADLLGDASYRQVGFDTLDFIHRDLAAEDVGYIASLSAVDEQGVEGGAYLWGDAELKATLDSRELELMRHYWSLAGSRDLEEGWLPRLGMTLAEAAEEAGTDPSLAQTLYQSAREKLLKARAKRTAPRDVKVLTAWNGLALRALARAAAAPGGERFRERAARLAEVIRDQMWDGSQLRRSLSDATVKANLADYAHAAEGLLAWHQSSADPAQLELAEALIRKAWGQFHNPRGWKMSLDELLKYGVEKPALEDGPLASPSAVLLRSALKLVKQGRLPDLAAKLRLARDAGYAVRPFRGISHLRLPATD